MRSSPILSIFEQHPPARRGPSGFMVSAVVHAVVCVGAYFALHHSYALVPTVVPQRYVVRMLELSPARPKPVQQVARRGKQSPTAPDDAAAGESGARAPAAEASADAAEAHAPEALAAARLPKDAISQLRSVQTMVVPETTKQMQMTRPLPQVMMWSAQNVKVSVIVAPPKPPSIAAVTASLMPPNNELHVADLKLSATPFPTMRPLPPPSNTAPVSSPDPAQVQQMLTALAQRAGPATPTDVIVASNLQLQSGVTVAPVFNAVAPAALAGSIHPGGEKGRTAEGTGVAIVAENGTGPGNGSGKAGDKAKGDGSGPGAGSVAGGAGSKDGDGRTGAGGAGAGSAGAGSTAAGAGFVVQGGGGSGEVAADGNLQGGLGQRQITRVVLPKDGKFGMVVIGNSTADEYPETVALWHSRIAYSVYLKVGAPQKWILQYALPSSATASLAMSDTRLEAPWPYDISRPSIDAAAQTDAIIVHGSLNATGHLESLAVVFPQQLAEASFLVHALQMWAFRPALRNGQPTVVDVLLIIPPVAE